MRFVFSIVLILLFNFYANGQQIFIDSVKEAFSHGDKSEMGEVFRKEGIKFKNKGDYDKAENLYQESLLSFEQSSDSIGIGNVYNNLALIYSRQNYNAKALDIYHRAIDLNKKINHTKGLVKVYVNLGNFFYSQSNFSKSLEYFYLCKETITNDDNTKMLALIHMGIGNILSNDEYEHNDLNIAKNEYMSALTIYKNRKDSLGMSNVYNNVGIIYENQNRYEEAIFYYRNSLNINESFNNKKELILNYLNIGNVLQKTQNSKQSLSYYEKGAQLAKELLDGTNYLHIISNIVNVKMSLGQVEEAIDLFDEYRELRDSIYNKDKSRQLTELQTLYETEQKERDLQQQISENEIKTRQNQRLILLSVALGAMVVVVFWLFYQRQKINIHLRNQEERLHKQELTRLEKEQEISTLNALMQGQEEERKRIAVDLHDQLGGKLSAIKLFHSNYITDDNESAQKVDQLLSETIQEIREISHNLASSVLMRFGLIPALEDLLEPLKSAKETQVHFSATDINERLPTELERALYYIIQELITNTIRHADANTISLQLIGLPKGAISIVFEDNGKGFDIDNIEEGLGLRNMRARLSPYSGELNIDSMIGKGSTFMIEIPPLVEA